LTGLRAGEQNDALFLIREEIAIMKKLNHPNLVQLIEVLDDPEEDSLYMVMEMCKKGVIMSVGLDESADPYNDESCRCWFRDLLLGIEYRTFSPFPFPRASFFFHSILFVFFSFFSQHHTSPTTQDGLALRRKASSNQPG